MSWDYYNGYRDSGLAASDQARFTQAQGLAPGKGKWFKQIMNDPGNSAFTSANKARTGNAMASFEEGFTYDPAMPPELQAQQLNKGKQQIQTAGAVENIGQLADMQKYAYGVNMQRKMNTFNTLTGMLDHQGDREAQMMQAQQHQGFWSKWGKTLLGAGLSIAGAIGTGGASAAWGAIGNIGGSMAHG